MTKTENNQEVLDNLEILSNHLRAKIQHLDIVFTKVEPMANKQGYTFCRKTGNLLKQTR